MKASSVASTASTIGKTALKLGVKLRTIWLAFLVGTLFGFLLGLAWALTVHYAPDLALNLIAQARAL